MTPEGRLVDFLRRRVAELGGATRKCEWSNHAGAPDIFVMLSGVHFWVELKQYGQKPRPIQTREHGLMRQAGCAVYVLDSKDKINDRLSWIIERYSEEEK